MSISGGDAFWSCPLAVGASKDGHRFFRDVLVLSDLCHDVAADGEDKHGVAARQGKYDRRQSMERHAERLEERSVYAPEDGGEWDAVRRGGARSEADAVSWHSAVSIASQVTFHQNGLKTGGEGDGCGELVVRRDDAGVSKDDRLLLREISEGL